MPGYNQLVWDQDYVVDPNKLLGAGGTAETFKGMLLNDRLKMQHNCQEIAVKVVRRGQGIPVRSVKDESFNFEVALMSSIPASPNIVGLIGYSYEPYNSIIMKYYHTNLKDFLRSRTQRSPALVHKIAIDIAEGLKTLHSVGILHLDIKPGMSYSNIYVNFINT